MVSQVVALEKQLHEMGIRHHYSNYPSLEFHDWAQAYYGENYPRLQLSKLKYDPNDRLSHLQSVKLPKVI
jgi:hypothetical protein